ncbi:MAG: response regulator [Pseudomonadota bacterium]
MPILSGLETLKLIRKKYPDLPVIIFTGANDLEMIKEAKTYNIPGVINKTGVIKVEIEKIVKLIETL